MQIGAPQDWLSEIAVAPISAATPNSAEPGAFFDALLDIVNPLQHLPVISSLYREWTGDAIAPVSRLIGDTLFGGVLGFVSSIANAMVESGTGRDIGQHVLAWLEADLAAPTAAVRQANQGYARVAGMSPPGSTIDVRY